jgi:hypothetical protein
MLERRLAKKTFTGPTSITGGTWLYEVVVRRVATAAGGHLVAYLTVPRNHPWYGRNCDHVNASSRGTTHFTWSDDHVPHGSSVEGWVLGCDWSMYPETTPKEALAEMREQIRQAPSPPRKELP